MSALGEPAGGEGTWRSAAAPGPGHRGQLVRQVAEAAARQKAGSHTLIGAAVDAIGIPPDKVSFPHALAAATDTVTAGFPPHELDLAVATFLLKVLDPQFLIRLRPDRTSPRATKKAGDFPARKDQPSVTTVTRKIQIHCLRSPQSD